MLLSRLVCYIFKGLFDPGCHGSIDSRVDFMSVQLSTMAYRLKPLYFGKLKRCFTRTRAGLIQNLSILRLFMVMKIISKKITVSN
jgi:hypothetical protein